MKKLKHIHFILMLSVLSTMTLAGCFFSKDTRTESTRRIAGPSFMLERREQAGLFDFLLYERIHNRGGVADIYIEGDDVDTGADPTPKNPVGLRMASRDKAKNVIYISRPCQYTGPNKTILGSVKDDDNLCDVKYSTTHRFAPEVIHSYDQLLTSIKRRWGISAFRLYGHSGGGALATLIASTRPDVLSLVTVAGNLDHRAYIAHIQTYVQSKAEPLRDSLNPVDVASKLVDLPQTHYVGSRDDVMPISALQSYLLAAGPSNCIRAYSLENVDYMEGWDEVWPEILADKPVCAGPVEAVKMY